VLCFQTDPVALLRKVKRFSAARGYLPVPRAGTPADAFISADVNL
jgi:hypothetical protein